MRPVLSATSKGGFGLIAVAMLLAFSGCTDATTGSPRAPSNATSGHQFSGPYADDFQDAYSRAGSDNVRRILADGVISGQEFAEVQSKVKSCLGDSDYTIKFDDRGGFEVGSKDGRYDADFQKKMHPILRACELKNDGEITYLYRQMIVNPAKLDDRRSIVQCFVENDLVPKGYSVRDFDRQNEDYSFPFGQFDSTGTACLDDPLGLWATRK